MMAAMRRDKAVYEKSWDKQDVHSLQEEGWRGVNVCGIKIKADDYHEAFGVANIMNTS